MSRRDKILNTVTKKPAPSVIRKTYIGRLVLRCLIFLQFLALVGYLFPFGFFICHKLPLLRFCNGYSSSPSPSLFPYT